jgi:hypothetical protein
MRYQLGAEQLQQVPSLAHRPDGVFRVARTAPVGPTHAVCAVTGATVRGINAEALEVLSEDWEAACFVENALTVRRRPRRRSRLVATSRRMRAAHG